MLKPLTVWITTNCRKFSKREEYQTTLPVSWETCIWVKKQQLEPSMEQLTGSKLGKEYIKAVYCHLVSCFQIVLLEKTLESSLACKEVKPVNPKENQSWIFIGRTDVKLKLQYFGAPDVKYWLNGKDSHAGKDWGQEEKRAAETEMVG